MAISHAAPGQTVDVSPFAGQLLQHKTAALFKSQDLEVMRVVLEAGKSVPPHQVPGEITIQCLEGELQITLDDHATVLYPGQLVFLGRGAVHGLVALQASSALVTIALRKSAT